MSSNDLKRYARQISLKELGIDGQKKIANASVVVIGAGGLGCPAIQYLAAGGVGKITIVDFDKIGLSNLHRQILFTEHDLGKFKAETAAEKVKLLNPDCEVGFLNRALDNELALTLFAECDVVIDGTDQIAVRYLINDACQISGKPWVHGSVDGWQGRWAVFNSNGPDYRDLFPNPPNPLTTGSCELNGVLGVVPGIVGMQMALETLKLITGTAEENSFLYQQNMLTGGFQSFEIPKMVRKSLNSQEFLEINFESWVMECHFPQKETQ